MIAALFKISLVSLLISLKWNQGNEQNCSALATFFLVFGVYYRWHKRHNPGRKIHIQPNWIENLEITQQD